MTGFFDDEDEENAPSMNETPSSRNRQGSFNRADNDEGDEGDSLEGPWDDDDAAMVRILLPLLLLGLGELTPIL